LTGSAGAPFRARGKRKDFAGDGKRNKRASDVPGNVLLVRAEVLLLITL